MTTDTNDAGKTMIEGALAAFRSNKGWADKAIAQLPGNAFHRARSQHEFHRGDHEARRGQLAFPLD